MFTVTITVPVANLAEAIASMRKWLSEHSCDTRTFTHKRHGNHVRITIEFDDDSQGKSFKAAFFETNISRDDVILLEPKLDWVVDFSSENANRYLSTPSMARVCWCRLMAAAVRTAAEELTSYTAKKTLHIVAETWDRLAENFERHLADVSHSTGDGATEEARSQPGSIPGPGH